MGFYGYTTYFKSACLQLLIDLASHSVGSRKISAPSNGESKDRAVGTYTSCKSKSRRLFYWREHTARMFIHVHTYAKLHMFVRVWMCLLRTVFVTVCTSAWYRTNKLTANTQAHTCSGLVLAWYHAGVDTSHEPRRFLAIVALFDILFAWYFCYVFYPVWVNRD